MRADWHGPLPVATFELPVPFRGSLRGTCADVEPVRPWYALPLGSGGRRVLVLNGLSWRLLACVFVFGGFACGGDDEAPSELQGEDAGDAAMLQDASDEADAGDIDASMPLE